jgi:hypothetical protein
MTTDQQRLTSAMEQFEVGRRRAAKAIRALLPIDERGEGMRQW